MRWMPAMPRYRTPIILQRAHDGSASQTGTNRIYEHRARYLKAFATSDLSEVSQPNGRGPASQTAPPDAVDGWAAWWPSAPDVSRGQYKLPDPPKIARPANPDRDNPILWEAAVPVEDGGSDAWTLRISAVYAFVEWIPERGQDKITGMRKLSINEARLKMRPGIVSIAGINAKEWEVVKQDDSEVWKLEAIVPSFRRGEFVELMVERTR